MKFTVFTLGCKVNQYESQAVAEIFENLGYGRAAHTETPDIVFVNSCSVTAESDRKTRQSVRKYRAKYPNSVIVLMGCMTSAHPSTAEDIPEADIVIGNVAHAELPRLVEQYLKTKERIVKIGEHKKGETYFTPEITDFQPHTRAFMKIEDGCDRFCTYCIIPYARGFVRSRDINDIKAEARSLAANGYKEIVLVGINLSSYGKDNGLTLFDAVRAVAEISGIERVRLGSLEPDLMSDELLKDLASVSKFCPQFHLSLQSGCDATLKRMNRHYDSAFYLDLVTRIRSTFENSAITTDIMVGFAGETDEEFLESLSFARRVGFAKAHIFAYSRRRGTLADKMAGQVSNAVKAERSRRMIEATKADEIAFLEGQCGTIAEVLFETKENGYFVGYTRNYTPVKVGSDAALGGKILMVKLTAVDNDCCLGEVIK